jgi:PIF1-like helicase
MEEVIKKYEEDLSNQGLRLPTKFNGETFELLNASHDQQPILSYILAKFRLWFDNINNPDFRPVPIRLTIAGVAGSGKSFLLNTLVTAIRRMFGTTDSVMVMAPTGEAAYNAGGTTVHHSLQVSVKGDMATSLTSEKITQMIRNNKNLVLATFDERSLLACVLLGKSEYNLRHTVYKGINKDLEWGNVPGVILFGDDYQLTSVEPGCLSVFSDAKPKSAAEAAGRETFRSLGKNVFFLKESKRHHNTQKRLRRILAALRAEPSLNEVSPRCKTIIYQHQISRSDFLTWQIHTSIQPELTDADAHHLCGLHLNNRATIKREEAEYISNHERTLFLFANNEPRNEHNKQKLRSTHSPANPVAKLRPVYTDEDDNPKRRQTRHFDVQIPPITYVCRNAKVEIKGRNLCPPLGLYNGAMGTIVDIVYHPNESPNTGHLPRYLLVRVPTYQGKPFFEHDPKVIPIVPIFRRCERRTRCCKQHYTPIKLCFAKTLHSFQGQQAGPVQKGCPENSIQRLVIDLGTRNFEGRSCPGLTYTSIGRVTEIAELDDILNGALYFTGEHMNPERICNLSKKFSTAQTYIAVQQRTKWMQYLHSHETRFHISDQDMTSLFHWANTFRPSEQQIHAFHRLFAPELT